MLRFFVLRNFARSPLLDAPAARQVAGFNGIVRPPSASMPRPAEFDIFDPATRFWHTPLPYVLCCCASVGKGWHELFSPWFYTRDLHQKLTPIHVTYPNLDLGTIESFLKYDLDHLHTQTHRVFSPYSRWKVTIWRKLLQARKRPGSLETFTSGITRPVLSWVQPVSMSSAAYRPIARRLLAAPTAAWVP